MKVLFGSGPLTAAEFVRLVKLLEVSNSAVIQWEANGTARVATIGGVDLFRDLDTQDFTAPEGHSVFRQLKEVRDSLLASAVPWSESRLDQEATFFAKLPCDGRYYHLLEDTVFGWIAEGAKGITAQEAIEAIDHEVERRRAEIQAEEDRLQRADHRARAMGIGTAPHYRRRSRKGGKRSRR